MTTQIPLKQPRALPVLFLTEFWERFGFYAVQGLLVLYITQALGFSDDYAYSISGAFTGFAYIASLFGGYYADRFIGFRISIIWGSILLCLGYAMLALNRSAFLVPSLAMITIGTGFFKPNISSFLGKFYQENDPRREAGFTIFYVGINSGVFLATSSIGFINQYFGWSIGFLTASIGMVFAFLIFFLNSKKFENIGLKPTLLANDKFKFLGSYLGLVLISILLVIIVSVFMNQTSLTNDLLVLAGVLIVAIYFMALRSEPNQIARHKFIVLGVLIFFSMFFWAIYFQIFFSVNLFIDRVVNRHIFGFEIPTVAFLSLEAIFITATGPILARFWGQPIANKALFSIPYKFSYSLGLLFFTFLTLYLSTFFTDSVQFISPWWIVLAYLILTLGEMFLSPIGLSAITLLAPKERAGLMMGIWFLSLGFGGKLGGALAKIGSIPDQITQRSQEIPFYQTAFLDYALIALVIFIIMLVAAPYLNKLIQSEKVNP